MSLNNGFKFYFSRNINDTDDPRFAAQDLSAETFGKIAVYKNGEARSSRDHSATRTACTTLK